MRKGSKKWLGPAKVVFQDDKVIFIRHGGVMVRVSPNRLMKAPEDATLTPMADHVAKNLNSQYRHPSITNLQLKFYQNMMDPDQKR